MSIKRRLGTTTRGNRRRAASRTPLVRRGVAGATALLLGASMTPALIAAQSASAAPVGQGFKLNASDLRFIFKQIQIAENHAATPRTPDNPCNGLVGDGPNQIPDVGNGKELPLGLRTVDGSCNNVFPFPERARWGAADTVFPRLVPGRFRAPYDVVAGNVTDVEVRRISNLVVDQTANNPAAIAAAGTDQAAPGDNRTLPIGNVAPDAGLSAPFNSWFTLFGQFFDHGLDLVTKDSNRLVMMPLAADDPLVVGGRDGNPATTADNVPVGTPMMLSRTTNQPGGAREATNTTTSYVDQNQTYTSHPSHQVFMREYDLRTAAGATCATAGPACRPVETGRLLTGPSGGMADWDAVQDQARLKLGIVLQDSDVLNVPLLSTDPYGHFLRGGNGFPQIATATGFVAASPGGLSLPGNTTRTGHAFLDDIAHHAVPRTGFTADPDGVLTPGLAALQCQGPPAAGETCLRQFDDELLGRHFVAGDGRVNENIGLTTVHHVFHSEHNRLRGEIDSMITNFAATGLTQAEANAWRTANTATGWGYGDRLFQAAKFVTEMEYQHLVFEEFARKVQPMVNVFGEEGGYHPGVNGAIRAEFAHAVYRFGHSMLTETVARRTPANVNRDMPLLDAFLNPTSFLEGGLTPDQAAGEVVRGMTRQSGNEIDEFVTEALRNNLLGLPLDLASINMARARDTGVPRLNEARRAFFAASGNSQVRPYASWADFGFSLKHPESLVNFVAAFGRHTTITGTLAARRSAAALLVYGNAGPDGFLGDNPATLDVNESLDDLTGTRPADAVAFLNDPAATTGVDDIDLWVGGLAEKQMVFGGLLGPTFNYVFELQLEDLQDADRFYYLHRLPGTNMLTQLEGNSFSELIMRNTDVEGLPADSFSRPDLVFNIGAGNTVLDNPDTPLPLDEAGLITTMGDGTLRFGGPEHSVWNGTSGNDRIWSSEGDDTIRGNDGNDWMEGGDGNDNHVGGLGNDILTDLNGDDVMKGGDGNDAISSGQGGGGDLTMGGFGNDFILGGNDITETFGGEGNDIIYAGDAEDVVFADGGDDWIEGGRGPFDQLFGDNGAIAQDDPNEAGHDVIMAEGVGEKDFDSEGGDDIMIYSTGIQRGEGMRGFDWATHRTDPRGPAPFDADMLNLVSAVPNVPAVEANRDRFDLTEGLSGAELNDILRGDDRGLADLTAGANEPANSHVLNLAGLNRITGLNTLFRANQVPTATRVFAAGNIIMGGGGADTIEGRGGDDIIDGDRQLVVELRAVYNNGTVRTVQTMRELQADVFAGLLNPGNIQIVRRIESIAGNNDVALFSSPQTEYTITQNADGTRTVAHDGGPAGPAIVGIDGTDTLRGIERMLFNQGTAGDTPDAPAAPTITNVTAGVNSATVTFVAGADGGLPITEFRVRVFEGAATTPSQTLVVPAPATSATVRGLTAGVPVRFEVLAVSAAGIGVASAASGSVTPTAPPNTGGTGAGTGGTGAGTGGTGAGTGTPPPAGPAVPPPAGSALKAPAAPAIGLARAGARGGTSSAVAKWRAPSSDGGTAVTGYRVLALKIGRNGQVTKVIRSNVVDADLRKLTMRLPDGTYRFRVLAVNAIGISPKSARSNAVSSR